MTLFWSVFILMLIGALFAVMLPLWRARRLAINFRYQSFVAILFLIVLLPASSVWFYDSWGHSDQLENYWGLQARAKLVKKELQKIKSPDEIIQKLTAHLQAHPESAKGWYLLGKLYFGLGRYQEADTALHKAVKLESTNNTYLTAYSEAFFFSHGKSLTPVLKNKLQLIAKKTPDNVSAVNLLAINAYNHKRFQHAVGYWEGLLPLFQPGSRDADQLLKMIGRAQQNLFTLEVDADISKDLRAKIKPNDIVLIYALSQSGSKVPLAVVRKRAGDLPITLSLNAAQAMVTGHMLKIGERVIVNVRVAKSAGVVSKPGDLLGASTPLRIHSGHNIVKITVNSIVGSSSQG